MQISRFAPTLLFVAACAPDESPKEVIAAVGHHRYLSATNQLLEPSPELYRHTQQALLERLTEEARTAGLDVEAERVHIAVTQPDAFLANASLIDWIVEHAPPGDRATIRAVNGAIRIDYAQTLPPGTPGAADALARVTFNSGQKYIDECRNADVPIPPPMYRTGAGNWNETGILTTNFLGGEAHVYEYRAPNGLCIALPRYGASPPGMPDTSPAGALGIICLGTRPTPDGTHKACFWDNPRGTEFPRGVEQPLENFVGGFDLQANGQGVCTDCHAGANPFVIHPNEAAFRTITGTDFAPNQWYEPIVHPNWPQNRGPTNLLAGVPSTGRCDREFCHASVTAGGTAGQFPILSAELDRYCHLVMANAAGIFGMTAQTMPPGTPGAASFAAHRNAIERACETKPDWGRTVNSPSTGGKAFVSSPTLQVVAYDCATRVAVHDVALHATVTLSVNGTSYSQEAKNTRDIEFALSEPLRVDDLITATQTINSIPSLPATLRVTDHRLMYPAGLPAPAINPDLIYECADVIAVAHVPGSTITISSSTGPDVTGTGAEGWNSIWPGTRPFRFGDTFSAVQRMCPDEPLSPPSPTATAAMAPGFMPTPVLDPPRGFSDQELINVTNLLNGAHTTFAVSGSYAGTLDAPISWWTRFNLASTLGRPLNTGDMPSARSQLCAMTATSSTIPVSTCQELPAPTIETPVLPGATAVVVLRAQPGARIHVYDSTGTEIGNSGGLRINLSRPLRPGEDITIVQALGGCRSSRAHLVTVLPG